MKYLADANVRCEPTRADPDAGVVGWLRENEAELAIDPVILGEIRFGILLLPKGKRRNRLERWFESGIARLRCLPFDRDASLRWAGLVAELRRSGRAMPIKDSLIAATALAHDLTVLTRNETDFAKAGVPIVNAFS